jgi:hypothetical protein
MRLLWFICLVALPCFGFARSLPIWEPVIVHYKDGSKISGEAKWRKKVPVGEIKLKQIIFQRDSSRVLRSKHSLHNIDWIQAGNKTYKTFNILVGEEKIWCLGEAIENTRWYKVLFEERDCLCNNSRRIVQAWLLEDMSNNKEQPVILRKKRFSDHFENPDLVRSVLGIGANDHLGSFSNFPARLFPGEP